MSFASIHNYYERLVFNEVSRRFSHANVETEFLSDVACVALNHLPPRYIRFEVDMAFYLSPTEREEIDNKVRNAVQTAVEYIEKHRKSSDATKR